MLKLQYALIESKKEYYDDIGRKEPEPTEAQKKRRRFGTMFTLHALMRRAGIRHENEHTLTCSGYIKSKDRF